MTKLQNKWAIRFTLSVVFLILTTELGQGWGWIIGWIMFGGFSLVRLASHGGVRYQ